MDAKNQIRSQVYRDLMTTRPGVALPLETYLPILRLHPKASKKIGPGVKRIFVAGKKDAPGTPRAFHIERKDGSVETFGWTQCIGKLDPDIRRQIDNELKERRPATKAPASGQERILREILATLKRIESKMEGASA